MVTTQIAGLPTGAVDLAGAEVHIENLWVDDAVLAADLDVLDNIPYRAFTRDNAFRLPSSWRPIVPELHNMRWRISIVQVTGQRDDGEFIYRFGGQSSEDAFFLIKNVPAELVKTLKAVDFEKKYKIPNINAWEKRLASSTQNSYKTFFRYNEFVVITR